MGDRTRSGGSASMTWATAPVVCGDSGSSVTRTVAPVLSREFSNATVLAIEPLGESRSQLIATKVAFRHTRAPKKHKWPRVSAAGG